MKRDFAERGFTLAELAVVMVIVALLLGGLFVPLTAQTDIKYRSETDKTLADIREALIGYAIVNGRLPCPAQSNISDTGANPGFEAVVAAGGPCMCTNVSAATANGVAAATGGTACQVSTVGGVNGVLPWATLGLPETDAWGNRYTYRVTTRFGRVASGQTSFGCSPPPTPNPPTNPANSAFALCSPGDITILATSGGATISSGIPAIAISHGKSGVGAWTTLGGQVPGTASSDEQKNTDSDATFVSNTSIDDQMIWLSPNLLMNRMIAAGKLP